MKNTIAFIIFLSIAVFSGIGIYADGLDGIESSLIRKWRWVETITPVEKVLPLPGEEYIIVFHEDGTVNMKLEINQINGNYTTNGKILTIIPPMIMTLASWLPDSPAPEFLNLIEHATGYFFKNEILYIDTLADGGTMRFEHEE